MPTADSGDAVDVSFVVPARDEEAYLPSTLASVAAMGCAATHEVVVVDGGSTDATASIAADHGARVVSQSSGGIGAGRHLGAERARGEWLAFVDADTVVRPGYADAMLAFVERAGLTAASSRCRMVGDPRAKLMEWVINYVFPRLDRPILPGFNFFVRRSAYLAAGGFPDVPNEDTAFSRRLARTEPTGYYPGVLVESSARRIRRSGLTGTLVHYLRLDWGRVRADY